MNRPAALLLCLIAATPGQAQTRSPADLGIGGLALRPCGDFVGPENTPLLAQSVDWMLGYLAGRIDAGDRPDPASVLTTTDQIDLVTGILGYCSENPEDLLLAAARDHARQVFGTMPETAVEEIAPDHVPRPELRPDDPEDGTAARLLD